MTLQNLNSTLISHQYCKLETSMFNVIKFSTFFLVLSISTPPNTPTPQFKQQVTVKSCTNLSKTWLSLFKIIYFFSDELQYFVRPIRMHFWVRTQNSWQFFFEKLYWTINSHSVHWSNISDGWRGRRGPHGRRTAPEWRTRPEQLWQSESPDHPLPQRWCNALQQAHPHHHGPLERRIPTETHN